MSDGEAELAEVAGIVEATLVKLVHYLGTRVAADPRVRAAIERAVVEGMHLRDQDKPTPLISPLPAVEVDLTTHGRRTEPSTPAAKRRG